MSTQPEALRLADLLAWGTATAFHHAQAAAELRRLHAQCDALLGALKDAMDVCIWPSTTVSNAFEKARAAIKAVEEGK